MVLCTSVGFDKCIMSYTHHYSVTQNSFTALKLPCPPSRHPSLFLSPSVFKNQYKCHLFCEMSPIPPIIMNLFDARIASFMPATHPMFCIVLGAYTQFSSFTSCMSLHEWPCHRFIPTTLSLDPVLNRSRMPAERNRIVSKY